MPRRTWAALALALLGCAPPAEEAGSVQLALREVAAAPSEVLIPLPDGRLVITSQDERLALVDPAAPEGEPAVVGVAQPIGAVHAVVERGDAALVLADGGTFVLRAGSLLPSPLADALDGPIRDAALVPPPSGRGEGDVWILTDASLYRLVGEQLTELELDGSVAGAQLAVTTRPEGRALWVLLEDRLLEVWRDRSGALRTARLRLEALPTRIASDAAGRGFAIVQGTAHVLSTDRRLRDLGVPAEDLLGSPTAEPLWIRGPAGGLFVHTAERLHRVEGFTLAEGELSALAGDGALFVAGAQDVVRASPRRYVRIDGPPDGALLGAPATLSIRAEGEPRVEASVDAEPVEVLVDERGGFAVSLDAGALEDGSHEVCVEVSYADGTLPTRQCRGFEIVRGATWSEHVEPIYQAECAACHGPEGPALTRLDEPDRWATPPLSDQILINVREGRMPLGRPPLSARQVALIEAWMTNGFAAGEEEAP